MNDQNYAEIVRFVNEELITRLIDFASRNEQSVEDAYLASFMEMAVFACNHGMPFSRLEEAIRAAWAIAKNDRGVLQ